MNQRIRFGILGVSDITPKFVEAARMAGCEVAAVSSRSLERAQDFAVRHGIPQAYGSYEEMLEREQLDCAYIDTIPVAHFEAVMLCLRYGVPVLCEKAMFTSEQEAKTAFSYAEEQKLFAMEALWSKFLPANRQAKAWLEAGKIGKPVLCDCMMGWRPTYPSRYFDPEMGGGPDFDLTVYAYEVMAYLLGQNPEVLDVRTAGEPGGVNLTEQIALQAGECLCTIRMSYRTACETGLTLQGEFGTIRLPMPHISREAILLERGGQEQHFRDEKTVNGFVYEIEEVVQCLRQGRLESAVQPHSATLACARFFDQIRRGSRILCSR